MDIVFIYFVLGEIDTEELRPGYKLCPDIKVDGMHACVCFMLLVLAVERI